ncbi:ectoine/hydroxyectoine ABC transporter substrate-binding protein EhuB [Nonomuraea sp. KC401]|uniref:ectoine/hydroxyectoine ABC transporter substrate-binding protein EhuB n=1 Tax=unclassified Nonomuraea TaxID=2593643 RepID=UPI0010FEFC9E|nr:ectoine/hydroxyectoine ABC transporter substrate-binding protein EhuB [Nonomuraea sp. KC401]NBE91995.1 ectoine/hydroxyectoine ABC transporter substrate-binding protein EhuB [Nonomuraea sp. K271]TLF74200.1 ectoine/hydroxyectoine ABC transporter substrate-binding protein EhuB [Nonomuraea sp. KC401]
MTANRWTRRDFFRSSGLTAAALVGGPALIAGCSRVDEGGGTTGASQGADPLARFKQTGTIKVGIANEQPYGYRDKDGNLTGEAPEVARAIFKALGVDTLEAQIVDSFGSLIPGLQSKQYDFIAAGMFIIPERCSQIAFSNPDYAGTTAFLVAKGNPKKLTSFEEIAKSGAKLGVLEGAVEKGYAEAGGVKDGQIQVFPNQNAAFKGILAGRVDAIALTAVSLRWTLQQQYADEPLEVTESFVPVVDGKEQLGAGGFGFRKEDTGLIEAFNAELKKLQDSNGVLPLIEKFGFTKTEVDNAAKLTAQQLCAGS